MDLHENQIKSNDAKLNSHVKIIRSMAKYYIPLNPLSIVGTIWLK